MQIDRKALAVVVIGCAGIDLVLMPCGLPWWLLTLACAAFGVATTYCGWRVKR